MQETGRITGQQMAFILYCVVSSTGTLILPSLTGALAKRDLWISPIWGALVGLIALLLAFGLNRLYPGENIIQQAPRILGFYLGKFIGFFYLISLIILAGSNTYQYTEFIKTVFLPRTPEMVIMGSIIFVCGLAARGGVELLGRSAQFVTPIFILIFTILIILSIQAWDANNFFPVMEHGVLPSVRGGITQSLWFSELFLISFLFPFIIKGEKKMRWSLLSLFGVLLTLILVNMSILAVFGIESHIYIFAFFKVTRYISYANFFEHLDAFSLATWILVIYVKIAFLIYITSLATAQWLHLSNYRPIVWPICLLAGGFGMWTAPTIFKLMTYLRSTGPWQFIVFLVIIPALLLLIAFFRKRMEVRAR